MSVTLQEILKCFLTEPEPPKDDVAADLIRLKEEMLRLNEDTASKKIGELREDIKRLNGQYHHPRLPYLYIYLSYAYSVYKIGYDSVEYAQKARDFSWASDWDRAIYHWFLGTLYATYDKISDAEIELKDAQNCLRRYENQAREAKETRLYSVTDKCKEIIAKINEQFARLPHRPSALPLSQKPEHRGKTPDAEPGQFRPRNGGNDSGSTNNNQKNLNAGFPPPVNVTVQIPLEINTNDVIECSFLQEQYNQQQTDVNNRLDNNPDMKQLIDMNQFTDESEHFLPIEMALLPQNQEQEQFIKSSSDLLMTPSLPFYGGVSAGPGGTVVLNDRKFVVNEQISLIRMDGKEYRIYVLKRDDKQIIIPRKDLLTSTLDPLIRDKLKLEGKIYGWLEVSGNSMNNASPIPIENGDLVLFEENRDQQSCKDQIVLVSIISDNQPRLMIKKLTEKGGKFFLHSESTFTSDPLTGDNYEQDLEFTPEHQLIGIVIAVASDKPKPPKFI